MKRVVVKLVGGVVARRASQPHPVPEITRSRGGGGEPAKRPTKIASVNQRRNVICWRLSPPKHRNAADDFNYVESSVWRNARLIVRGMRREQNCRA
jgi:hypothetical protein